jgi:enoyl-CoA hydratase
VTVALLDTSGIAVYPVLAGLEPGDRVVTNGSFLIDAETRLNPAAGSIYLGASSGRSSGASMPTRPTMPGNEADEIQAELAKLDPPAGRELAMRGQHVLDLVENLGKPVIAAINGFALGGGCELAMACTFRLAADTAKLGQPEVNLGIIPGYAGTQRLSRLVGRDRAMDLVLTGRQVTADEAFQMGLVTRVVPAARLMDEVKTLAATIAAKSPLTVRLAIDAVNRGLDMTLAEGCQFEASLFGLAVASEDMREGTRAFLEKRKPAFKGR